MFTLGFVLLPVAVVLNALGIGRMGVAPVAAWAGIVVMLLGIALGIALWAWATFRRPNPRPEGV